MSKTPATERVRDFFSAHGIEIEIKEFPAGTRTAQQAADAVNAPLGSIVKSLVFIAGEKVVLALVAGDQRGDAEKTLAPHSLSAHLRRTADAVQVSLRGLACVRCSAGVARRVGAVNARIANADEVRKHTSFVIGGVPPAAHPEKLETLVDESLLRFKTVWAAAGTPYAVFEIETEKLLGLAHGQIADIIVHTN